MWNHTILPSETCRYSSTNLWKQLLNKFSFITIPFIFDWMSIIICQVLLCVCYFQGWCIRYFLSLFICEKPSSFFPTWVILFWGSYAWVNSKFIFFWEFWKYFSNIVFLTWNKTRTCLKLIQYLIFVCDMLYICLIA